MPSHTNAEKLLDYFVSLGDDETKTCHGDDAVLALIREHLDGTLDVEKQITIRRVRHCACGQFYTTHEQNRECVENERLREVGR